MDLLKLHLLLPDLLVQHLVVPLDLGLFSLVFLQLIDVLLHVEIVDFLLTALLETGNLLLCIRLGLLVVKELTKALLVLLVDLDHEFTLLRGDDKPVVFNKLDALLFL